MGQIHQQGDKLIISQMFNQQQSLYELQSQLKSNAYFNKLYFNNVGIKIMKQALKVYSQLNIEHIEIKYDWNYIMVKPQLVCYDKNTWKTLQQLSNWNRQWNLLCDNCYNLKSLHADLSVSWMDDQFVKAFLEGLTRLANIQQVCLKVKSKDPNVQKMLQAFKQAQIFPNFQYKFQKI